MNKISLLAVIQMLFVLSIAAQTGTTLPNPDLSKRVALAPEGIFKIFRDAGMDPAKHELTEEERVEVEKAFALLPPLHRRVLNKHLHSISFMDNMPNTALTSPVESQDSTKIFNITFRAGILNETISEWATKKENTCYTKSNNQDIEVVIEAGNLDAFVYLLLHEATHVVDAVLDLTPHSVHWEPTVESTLYTKNIWLQMNRPASVFTDSLLEKTLFRGGSVVDITLAPEIYRRLSELPFPSLYSTASWFEDIAEMETIYHLTKKMKQPFRVLVKQNHVTLVKYEPMKNKRLRNRLKQLDIFYKA